MTAAARQIEKERELEDLDRKIKPMSAELRDTTEAEELKGMSEADTVQKLRALVKEEDDVQQKRKEHFFSRAFVRTNPGTQFPASWFSAARSSRGTAPS